MLIERNTIIEAVDSAQEWFDDPPQNESSTCEWVIVPLLQAAGYSRRDILPRASDNTGEFPDYTLLANDPDNTWFLEVKAWNIPLDTRHEHQAIRYAHQAGKRWAILTNGQLWRLYDDTVMGTSRR